MKILEIGGKVFDEQACRQITDEIIACLRRRELTVCQAEYFLDEVKDEMKNVVV